MNFLRATGHLLRGRMKLWLCYTSVTGRTCEACLAWHGRIVARPEEFLSRDSCPHEVEGFPVWKLTAYRERGARMMARAQAEVRRRKLLREVHALLATDPQRALALMDEAAAVDLFLPEVEALAREPALVDPVLRARVREVLLRRWKSKFTQERYERQPELARTQQERWGARFIQEILG